MSFGKTVRELRKQQKLTQVELGKLIGVSDRTIIKYEDTESHPKKRETYYKLAAVFGVDVNVLLTDNTNFVLESKEKYGLHGAKQAQNLVKQMSGLFAGGELSEGDMDEVMIAMQKAYFRAKEINKKYIPKKHLQNDE